MAEPLAEPALHHRAGDEERERRSGESSRWRTRRTPSPGGGRERAPLRQREHGGGENRKRADDDRTIVAAKIAKRCHAAAVRPSGRGEPDRQASARMAMLADPRRARRRTTAAAGSPSCSSRRFLAIPAAEPTARPWTTPCSPGRTYCQVSAYSPVDACVAAGAAGDRRGRAPAGLESALPRCG